MVAQNETAASFGSTLFMLQLSVVISLLPNNLHIKASHLNKAQRYERVEYNSSIHRIVKTPISNMASDYLTSFCMNFMIQFELIQPNCSPWHRPLDDPPNDPSTNNEYKQMQSASERRRERSRLKRGIRRSRCGFCVPTCNDLEGKVDDTIVAGSTQSGKR